MIQYVLLYILFAYRLYGNCDKFKCHIILASYIVQSFRQGDFTNLCSSGGEIQAQMHT